MCSLLLDQETEALREKAEKFHLEEEARCKLEQTVERSEARLSHTQLLLDKEKAKYQSAWRQQEVSGEARHRHLSERGTGNRYPFRFYYLINNGVLRTGVNVSWRWPPRKMVDDWVLTCWNRDPCVVCVVCEVDASKAPVFVEEGRRSLRGVRGAAGAAGREPGQTGRPAGPAEASDGGEGTSPGWAQTAAGASPEQGVRELAGPYANASVRQGLCLELQEEKQALRADVGRLNSSMADLKEYVQTLRERESLNPLPTMPQSRKTVHTADDRHVL